MVIDFSQIARKKIVCLTIFRKKIPIVHVFVSNTVICEGKKDNNYPCSFKSRITDAVSAVKYVIDYLAGLSPDHVKKTRQAVGPERKTKFFYRTVLNLANSFPRNGK